MGIVRTRLLPALFLPLLFLPPARAFAQPRPIARAVQLGYDNDLLSVRGPGKPPDFDYTSGARVSVFRSGAAHWMKRLTGANRDCSVSSRHAETCIASALGVSHQIYTPRENSETPIAGQRPYAGWLYGSLDMSLVRDGWSRSFGVDGGVTGPMSFAEQVQNGMHGLMHTRQQLGWKNQLPNAPGIVLRYAEGRRVERAANGAYASADVHWGAAAGNIVNALSLGTETTVGLRGALPWSPAEPRAASPPRMFLLLGYQQDLVVHSVLIDGRGAGPGATRRPWVGQFEAGAGYRRRSFGMVYRHVVRGREYEAQPQRHAYGSLALTAAW